MMVMVMSAMLKGMAMAMLTMLTVMARAMRMTTMAMVVMMVVLMAMAVLTRMTITVVVIAAAAVDRSALATTAALVIIAAVEIGSRLHCYSMRFERTANGCNCRATFPTSPLRNLAYPWQSSARASHAPRGASIRRCLSSSSSS